MNVFLALRIGLITIFCSILSLDGNSQSDSLNYHFYTLNDRYGVFEINETNGDTSFIVGTIKIPSTLDTIYFKQLIDTVILESGGIGGINTQSVYGVSPPKNMEFESNAITSKFMFLGGKHDLLIFPELNYVLYDSLTISYKQPNDGDTLHMVNFSPTEFIDIRIENANMKSYRFTVRNNGRAHTRKKNVTGMLDYFYLTFDAYCSKNPNNINVRAITNGKILLGRRSYVFVIQ